MTAMKRISTPPIVQFVGEVHHPDFGEAIDLLRSQARVVVAASQSPELIVIAQSRPGAVSVRQVEAVRRAAPLAGIVALLGSWCEGEMRTGRPWPGVQRLYWYEFPAWWRRQLTLRAEGCCPDWAQPDGSRLALPNSIVTQGKFVGEPSRGQLVVIQANERETAGTLTDVFSRAGFATVCQRSGSAAISVRGATAGIWVGGQLDDREASELSKFCRQITVDGAPAVAILDFPRRDAVDRAQQCGAAVVVGKPWINRELVENIAAVVASIKVARAA